VSFTFRCSALNPDDYRDKKLIWFSQERVGYFDLFPSISMDRKTFILTASGFDLNSTVSNRREDQFPRVTKQIDQDTFRKMERPKSRLLQLLCDFVIFDNSPRAKAKLGRSDLKR